MDTALGSCVKWPWIWFIFSTIKEEVLLNALLHWDAGFVASHITLFLSSSFCKFRFDLVVEIYRSWGVRSTFCQLVDWLPSPSLWNLWRSPSHRSFWILIPIWCPRKQIADLFMHSISVDLSASDHFDLFLVSVVIRLFYQHVGKPGNSCYNMLDVLVACRWLPFMWRRKSWNLYRGPEARSSQLVIVGYWSHSGVLMLERMKIQGVYFVEGDGLHRRFLQANGGDCSFLAI